MKLPIKKEYFDQIKSGKKKFEYRENHITFVCEETGETLVKRVVASDVIYYLDLPKELQQKDFLTGKWFIEFELGD
jgi:ASC-1-like (ASCH) protein